MQGIVYSAHHDSSSSYANASYRDGIIAVHKDGIVYSAHHDSSSSYASASYRGEIMAVYEDGIIYSACHNSSSSRADSFNRGEIIAKYDGDRDGAAAAVAVMILGMMGLKNPYETDEGSQKKGDGCINLIGILAVPILIIIFVSFIYLPLIFGLVFLIWRLILAFVHKNFKLGFGNIFKGVLFGIAIGLTSLVVFDALTVIPGIVDDSFIDSTFEAMGSYIKLSFFCYILSGILLFCDEEQKPSKRAIVTVSIISIIGLIAYIIIPIAFLLIEGFENPIDLLWKMLF